MNVNEALTALEGMAKEVTDGSRQAMKFIKRPIVVEAIQWLGDNSEDIAAFMGTPANNPKNTNILYVSTLEGVTKAFKYDWIIRGIEGEYYPCKPGIFANTYDRTGV